MNGGSGDDAVVIKYTCKTYWMGLDFALIPPIVLFFVNDFQYWLPFILVGILFGELWVGQEPDVCIEEKKRIDAAEAAADAAEEAAQAAADAAEEAKKAAEDK